MDNQNYLQPLETPEMRAYRAGIFAVLAVPTLVYAALYTLCLYNNFSSITMPFFVVIAIGYSRYVTRRLGEPKTLRAPACAGDKKRLKPMEIFSMAGMLMLGISTACTGSGILQCMNNFGIFLLLVTMLLCQNCDMRTWTLSKGMFSIAQAVFGAVGELGEPFGDMGRYRKSREGEKSTTSFYILIGIFAALPILVVILALLHSADAVFASMMDTVFHPDFGFGTVLGVTLTFFYAFLSAYCGMRYLNKGRITSACKDYRSFEPLIANTVLTLVAAVYLVFSVIQVLYLFWGKMELPEGYTYAAYAREGFFQLLFVCLLNVFMVLFFMGCFRENRMKNVLLTVISLCTYIMIASSAMRMCLYIQAYGLTFLRVFVLWTLALLAFLLAGLAISVYHKAFPVFAYTVVVMTLGTLCLTFAHPDYWIASYNLAGRKSGTADEYYLSYLSSDAAPVIAKEDGKWVLDYVNHLEDDLSAGGLHYNFSKAYAGKLLADKTGVNNFEN